MVPLFVVVAVVLSLLENLPGVGQITLWENKMSSFEILGLFACVIAVIIIAMLIMEGLQ
jgi:hypothetical protein